MVFIRNGKRMKHSKKWKRCVRAVQKTGKSKANAYAVCTASLGEESFVLARKTGPKRKKRRS